jgi:predicted AAA+ superfamily ATPase
MTDDKELTPNDIRELYRPRIIDSATNKSLSLFGGVLITGPKWCGKSWTGVCHSNSAIFLNREETRRLALLDLDAILRGEYPMLVDEWQEVPQLWDVARLKIDFSARKGLFIFTGSTLPPKKSVSHTGTGRFIPLRMHTMSLYESGDSNGRISLSKLFEGGAVETVKSTLDYSKTVYLICRGGWPTSIGIDEDYVSELPDAYLNMVVAKDASEVDGKKRSPALVRKLLLSLARNTATPASLNALGKDMAEEGGMPAEATIRDYLDALRKLFLVEEQFGWSPNLRSKVRIQSSPRRHLTDPSLAAALLCGGPGELKQDPNTAGFLFESLCYRDLCIYASAIGGEVFYYRDNNGAEVDFIIQLKDGRWGAAEAKMGVFEFEKATRNLFRVKDKMVARGAREPSFLMILNATGKIAVKRDDGIVEVPVDCLGP